jgi:hypothetical protein
MLANRDEMVKEVTPVMYSMLGRLLRRLFRLTLAAGAVAGIVALARRTMGSLAGEPGTPRSPSFPGASGPGSSNGGITRPHSGVPMSFDSWPPVPRAPHRSKD